MARHIGHRTAMQLLSVRLRKQKYPEEHVQRYYDKKLNKDDDDTAARPCRVPDEIKRQMCKSYLKFGLSIVCEVLIEVFFVLQLKHERLQAAQIFLILLFLLRMASVHHTQPPLAPVRMVAPVAAAVHAVAASLLAGQLRRQV